MMATSIENKPDVRAGSADVSRTTRTSDILLLLGLAACLALLVTRGILTSPGNIQYSADFSAHTQSSHELDNWRGAWNPYLGDDNSATISQAPPFLLLVPLLGSEWAQKLLLLAVYFLMASAAAVTTYLWVRSISPGRSLPIAALSAIIYTVNPWVSVESIHLYYLLLYALLPLTVHWVRKGLSSSSGARTFRAFIAAGLATAATLTAYGIAFHAMLVCVLSAAFLAAGPGILRARAKTTLVAVAGYGTALFVAAFYWILPITFGFRTGFSSGTSWALFTTKDLFILSPITPLWLNIAGFYRATTAFLVDAAAGAPVAAIALVGGYGLLAGSALLFVVRSSRRRWAEGGLAAGVILFAWLAKGTGFPRGDLYAELAGAPGIRRIAFVVLKGPYKLIPVVVFCLVTLTMLALASIKMRSRLHRAGFTVVLVLVLAWSVVGGMPLLTGDLAGYMRPVSIPASIGDSLARSGLDALATPGRVVWLPFQGDGNDEPPWAEARSEIPLIGGRIPPLPGWVSPVAISSRGVSWLGPALGRTFDLIVGDLVNGESPDDVGRFLLANGRSAIAVRTDLTEGRTVATNLGRRPDFRQVYGDGILAVFRPGAPPPTASDGVVVTVGGVRQVVMESARGAGPLLRPHILSAHLPDAARSASWWNSVRQVTFAGRRDWLDLALDSPQSGISRLFAADYVTQTVPLSEWDKDFFESNTWLASRLRQFPEQSYDPTVSPNFLVTSTDARLVVPIHRTTSCECQVWIRAFVSAKSEAISVTTESGQRGSASSYDETTTGWRWLRGPVVSLQAGRHALSLDVVGSFNALDAVVVSPVGTVESIADRMRASLAGADVVVDGGTAPRPGSSSGAGTAWIPEPGRYRLVVRSRMPSSQGSAVVASRDILLRRNSNSSWLVSDEVELSSGDVHVSVPDDFGTDARALLWLSRGKLKADFQGSPEMPPTNVGLVATRTSHPYNAHWVGTQGDRSLRPVRFNGFSTGFLHDAGKPLSVRFGPERWIVPGRVGSILGLLMLAAYGIRRRTVGVEHDAD